jgi:hypothetical protein
MAGTAANGKEWARANPAKVADFGDRICSKSLKPEEQPDDPGGRAHGSDAGQPKQREPRKFLVERPVASRRHQ